MSDETPAVGDEHIDPETGAIGTVEAPADVPLPPLMHFRCPKKGHTNVGEFSMQIVTDAGGQRATWDTGPLCPTCFVSMLQNRCQTHRVAPPEDDA